MMLNWEERLDLGLMQARVYSYAIDGTPVLMFTVSAGTEGYHVTGADGHVLAREFWQGADAGSMVASQVHGQAALREIVARLALSV